MRNGPAALHHYVPVARDTALRRTLAQPRRSTRPLSAQSPPLARHWRGAGRLALGLARRPMLALTLAFAAILLFSAAGEALAAHHIDETTLRIHQQNSALQLQLTQTAQQITHLRDAQTIRQEAQQLGWQSPQP